MKSYYHILYTKPKITLNKHMKLPLDQYNILMKGDVLILKTGQEKL